MNDFLGNLFNNQNASQDIQSKAPAPTQNPPLPKLLTNLGNLFGFLQNQQDNQGGKDIAGLKAQAPKISPTLQSATIATEKVTPSQQNQALQRANDLIAKGINANKAENRNGITMSRGIVFGAIDSNPAMSLANKGVEYAKKSLNKDNPSSKPQGLQKVNQKSAITSASRHENAQLDSYKRDVERGQEALKKYNAHKEEEKRGKIKEAQERGQKEQQREGRIAALIYEIELREKAYASKRKTPGETKNPPLFFQENLANHRAKQGAIDEMAKDLARNQFLDKEADEARRRGMSKEGARSHAQRVVGNNEKLVGRLAADSRPHATRIVEERSGNQWNRGR